MNEIRGQGERQVDLEDRVIVLADLEAVSQEAAERFRRLARQNRNRPFTVALAGGSTPQRLYELLALPPLREQIPWGQVHVFWGDERIVPPDAEQSNYRMARQTLLDHVPLPAENVHRVRGELEPEAAAREYEDALRAVFRTPWPRFDLVLLGLGKDGHIASLFPDSNALQETGRPVATSTATYEGRPAQRVTLTLPSINAAKHVIFMVVGAAKSEIVEAVLQEATRRYPAQKIDPPAGQVVWLLDAAAAGRLGEVDRENR